MTDSARDDSQPDANQPDFTRQSCWAPGVLVPAFQMRRDFFGARRLVPIDDQADVIKRTLLAIFGIRNWDVVEGLVVNVLDSLTDLDGEIDAAGLEKFRFTLANIIESRPKGVAELGYVVLGEKLKLAMTLHFRQLAHSTSVLQVDRSQGAFERLIRLHSELGEGLRRQRLSASVIAAGSHTGQAVSDGTGTPAKLGNAAKRRDKTMKSSSDIASEGHPSEVKGDAIPSSEKPEAAK
jgi:hypothetical protein